MSVFEWEDLGVEQCVYMYMDWGDIYQKELYDIVTATMYEKMEKINLKTWWHENGTCSHAAARDIDKKTKRFALLCSYIHLLFISFPSPVCSNSVIEKQKRKSQYHHINTLLSSTHYRRNPLAKK